MQYGQPQQHLQGQGQVQGQNPQLSNYDLLNKDWVPMWFRSEQTLNMPQNQLREAMIHMRSPAHSPFLLGLLAGTP